MSIAATKSRPSTSVSSSSSITTTFGSKTLNKLVTRQKVIFSLFFRLTGEGRSREKICSHARDRRKNVHLKFILIPSEHHSELIPPNEGKALVNENKCVHEWLFRMASSSSYFQVIYSACVSLLFF